MYRSSIQYVPYIIVALLILGPLLLPGYILTMDMVFTPHIPLPTEVNASYPFYALLHYLGYFIPVDLLQKGLLIGIMAGAGIGMHRLLGYVLPDTVPRTAIYVGAIFYVFNSYIYERLMMGQFAVVAGYALLPFFTLSMMAWMETLKWRQLWWTTAWSVLIMIMSIHTLVPMVLIAIATAAYMLVRRRHDKRYRQRFSGQLGAGLGVLLIVSLYWIIPTLQGSNLIAAASRGDNASGFASQGSILSLLRLQGFWAENRGLFLMPQDIAFLPGVWQTSLWGIMALGGVVLWRRSRSTAIALGTVSVFALMIAMGVMGSNIYRDPHKIMVIIAMCSAVLLSIGVGWGIRKISRGRIRLGAQVGLLVLPVLATPVLLWGCSGQLQTTTYPREWYAMNEQLNRLGNDETAIFLPWHLYQRFSFSPRIIAHPAQTFFDPHDVLVNDDPEFAGVRPLKADSRKQEISRLLSERPQEISERLKDLGVDYIIFARESDYEDVEFITREPGVTKMFNSGRLELYRLGKSS